MKLSTKICTTYLIIILFFFTSCGKETIKNNTVTDIDGNTYKTVVIGSQVWMAENLKVTRYRNGDLIDKVTNDTVWRNLTSGAYCSYDNDDSIAAIYGYLYNGFAAIDARNIAPEGWHIPSDAEWSILTINLGGESLAGGALKEEGTLHWLPPNTGATNSSGFNGLPGGIRMPNLVLVGILGGNFRSIGEFGHWLSSTPYDDNALIRRFLTSEYAYIQQWDAYPTSSGYSIRCVKD